MNGSAQLSPWFRRGGVDISSWRFYQTLLRGSHRALVGAIAIAVLQSLVLLPIPFIVGSVLDQGLASRGYGHLWQAGALMIALFAANAALSLWTQKKVLTIVKAVTCELRDQMLQKLYRLSRHAYTGARRGQLHTVWVQDTERVDAMSYALIAQVLPCGLISVVLTGMLFYLDWTLALLSMMVVPALVLSNRLLSSRLRAEARRFKKAFEAFSSGALFVLRTMDLTRIQAAETMEARRQQAVLRSLEKSSIDVSWTDRAYGVLHQSILAAFGVVVLMVGGKAIIDGTMNLSEVFSFYAALALLSRYASAMLSWIPRIALGKESLKALSNFVGLQDQPSYAGQMEIPFTGQITLRSVHFQYQPNKPLLRDVNLTIRPGSSIVIIGPNGSGKSTILNLILGFHIPQGGHVSADGRPYELIDIQALRRRFGFVPQDPIIFPGTIRENICYGVAEAEEHEILRAAQLATAHEFIEGLPDGYESFVGEEGVLLSGGQRQRIAVARALLRRPAVLMLDEPTNHLDRDVIDRLLMNLVVLEDRPSTIIISHDERVVRQADEVYALQHGVLVETNLMKEQEPVVEKSRSAS